MARGCEEASATVFHPSDPLPVPQGRPSSAAVSYHVGLDTMMGRRSRHRPEEVAIDGFLLLDTGEYELVTALIPLDVFWKMKALDILGQVRTANRARAARPSAYPAGRQCLAGRWRPRAAHDRVGRQRRRHAARRADGGAELLPLADEVLRASREGQQIDAERASLPAAGSRVSIRSIGWPSNRKVPASSRPCTCATCFRSSGQIEPRRGATKSPAVAGLLSLGQEAVRAFPPTRRLRAALPRGSCRTSSG